MTLFKTRDWWSFTPEEHIEQEEYNTGSLLVENITNDGSNNCKFVIGGFSGILRIFNPLLTELEDGSKISGYKADHLLLEVNLGQPILHLEAGKFVSGNENVHLCILHSDHFVVYNVTIVKGQTGHGTQVKLNKVYQHKFQRKAFSLTTGNFGSVKGRDFIAIQSLDGCVSVYEQESLGFVCFLPGFLLPGPIAYLPKSDMIVTQASDWTMQSYKYQTLSELVQNKDTNPKSGGKRIQPEWTQIMSEAALDIKILVERGNVSSVVVLTTHSFLCYKDSGIVKFIKKLEYNPSCFTAYHNEKVIYVCVASHTSNLLIYKENQLKWAAQLPFVPVAMQRGSFQGINSGLILLGEFGELQVSYLGTDPSLFSAPPAETREINYDETDKEMAELNKIIRSSTKDAASFLNISKRDKDINIATSIGTKLETWIGPTRIIDPDGIPCVTVIIKLNNPSPVNAVRVNVNVEKPIAVTQNTFVIGTLCDATQILVKFFLDEPYIPPSLRVNIIASYISATGVPHVINKEIYLPLKLVVKSSVPSKEADYKITISTSKPAVMLSDIFPEFVDGSSSTALGFQHYGGANVTLLSSRTSNRYRLQSDSLAAIWLILDTLVERLENYWSKNESAQDEKLTFGVTSPIPLSELYGEIDAHFLRRRKHSELEAQLVQRAVQFRAVQRRLLTKFKDKTPTPITNLDNLLEGTYKQILQITELINQNIKGLEEDGCLLSCVLRLCLKLLFLQTPIDEEHQKLITATLTPIIYTNNDQGWEEITNCSVSFILRTILGKGVRDAASYSQTLSMPSDTNKLKKHIGLLVDKITKGGFANQDGLKGKKAKKKDISPMEDKFIVDGDDTVAFNQSIKLDAEDRTEVPLGSKLGEDRARSARIRSARLMSAKSKPQKVNSIENIDSESSGNQDSEIRDQPFVDEENTDNPDTEISNPPLEEINNYEPSKSSLKDEEINSNNYERWKSSSVDEEANSETKSSLIDGDYDEIKNLSLVNDLTTDNSKIKESLINHENTNEESYSTDTQLPRSKSPVYEEIGENTEEPIYAEVTQSLLVQSNTEENSTTDSSKDEIIHNKSNLDLLEDEQNDVENMKQSLNVKDNLIETPEDIFGNPVEDDAW